MGGALFNTQRLKTDQYNIYKDEISDKLKSLNKIFYFPDSFKDKEDHGDLDVITHYPLIPIEYLKETFDIGDEDIHINTSVISFKYKDFQVDLCHFEYEDLESALNYYRQSDCSNMIGVLSTSATGYRMTHRGLTYPVKINESDQLTEILVSKDQERIFQFLDLNYNQWKNGFKNPKELFVWITESKYFNADSFLFENLNHQNRTRNKKRKIYSEFVDFLKDNYNNFKNSYTTQNKQHHLFRGLLHFRAGGNWINQAEYYIQDRHIHIISAKIFNAGDIITETGLTGKDVGDCVKAFHQYLHLTCLVHPTNLHQFIYDSTKTQMLNYFRDFYHEFKKTKQSK